MRRLAAIFAPKRSSKSEASDVTPSESQHSQHTVHTTKSKLKARGSFLRTFSRSGTSDSAPQAEPPHPQVNTGAYSSSSSSSGGPHTPDDDRASLFRNKSSNLWPPNPWSADPRPSNEPYSINPADPHFIKQDPTMLSPMNPSLPRHSHEDTDEDTSSEESSESEGPALVNTVMSSIDYLRILTVNATEPPFSPPPLLHIPRCPVFPRSSNLSHVIQRDETLHSSMLKRRLFHRLEQGKLSRSDELFLRSFDNRPKPPPTKRPSLGLDDTALRERSCLAMYSQGLKHWISRPCFEERLVLYTPSPETGEVVMRGIVGTNLGVAELEFSEGIEALAGLYEPFDLLPADAALSIHSVSPTNATPPLPPLSMSSSSSSVSSMLSSPPVVSPPATSSTTSHSGHKPQPQQTSSSSQNRNSYRAAPSPLRIESSSAPSPRPSAAPLSTSPSQASTVLASPLSSPTIVLSPSSPEPPELPAKSPPTNPPMKLGVRFAEEEKEDGVPLGYVYRIKQKREQKARFLEAEKQRRIHEDDRRRFEEERRRQEAERKKWEQERAAWEKEKRAIEEERKKKLYAEELAAARSRRESTRFGNMPRSDSDPTLTSERERANRGRVSQERYTRPLYDTNASTPRRQGSEPTIPSPRTRKESSPSSSRPPSVVHAGSNNGSVRGSSRPPSMYSSPQSSTPDVSKRDRRESKGSRRGSMASVADAQQAMFNQAAFTTGFPWNMNMNPMIPPVPPMPGMSPMPMVPMVPYMMDMPLLPPSPPFMMQQFGRPQQRSHSSSPTTGTNRLPASQSSDRVNKQGISRGGHERRASGDISEIQRSRASTPRSASNDKSSKVPPPNIPRTSGNRAQSGPDSPSGSKPRSVSRHSAVPSSYIPPQSSSSQKPIQPIPVMTTSRTQPAFQNLSRPQANRRQTMIS